MDKEFVDGLIAKAPSHKSPSFVKCKLSIKRLDLIEWLSKRNDVWVYVEVKVSRQGKWYAEVDHWEPETPSDHGATRNKGPVHDNVERFDDDEDLIPF